MKLDNRCFLNTHHTLGKEKELRRVLAPDKVNSALTLVKEEKKEIKNGSNKFKIDTLKYSHK